jgi:hypothetical protein
VNLLVYTLLVVLPVVAVGQTTKKQSPQPRPSAPSKLFSLVEVIGIESFARTYWELAAEKNADYKPKSAQEAIAGIDEFIGSSVGTDEGRRGLLVEQALFKKHRASLSDLVSLSLLPLLYDEAPVRFALKDEALTLLLTTLASEDVYNTLRLDAKQRAATEIQAVALPAIKQFRVVDSPDIKNVGVLVVYGTRDFSKSDSILTRKGELVGLVAQADRCKRLGRAELTEEEFVDTADVYLVDRDMTSGVRKIKVSLSDAAK